MHEVCRFHNKMINLPLKDFNSSEMDLLMSICSKLKNKEDDIVQFTFTELRKLAHYKGKSNTQLIESLKKVNDKLMSLEMTLETKNEYVKFILFPTYRINKEEGCLTVRVNPDFIYLLNSLTRNFTDFELNEFASLKSRYSKKCYCMLKKFKYKGVWRVKFDEFKNILDIPESYNAREINRRVIKPIEDELTPIFKNLTIEAVRDRHNRRHPIIRYEFYFDEEYYMPIFDNDNDSEKKPSGHICPICGKPLFEKIIRGSNCWCHPNALKDKNTCKKIFNSIEEIYTFNKK